MNRTLLSIISICVIAGCSQPTSLNLPPPIPQGVEGIVFDIDTKAPIRGATVELEFHKLLITTTTNDSGIYSLENVPAGQYTIRVRAPEYALDTDYVTIDSEHLIMEMLPLSTVSLTRGLVLKYMFDGTAADSSIYHHVTIQSKAVLVPDRFNRPNSAFLCDGKSTYVTIENAPALNFGKSDFSVCFWAKGVSSYYSTILGKSNNGTPFLGYRITGGSSSSRYVYFGTTYGEITATSYISTDTGRWHFFVYSFDRRGSISVNVDGYPYSLELSQGGTSQMAGNSDVNVPLMIGGDSSGNWSKGIIDDVRIYRGLLNPAQINLLYHENGW